MYTNRRYWSVAGNSHTHIFLPPQVFRIFNPATLVALKFASGFYHTGTGQYWRRTLFSAYLLLMYAYWGVKKALKPAFLSSFGITDVCLLLLQMLPALIFPTRKIPYIFRLATFSAVKPALSFYLACVPFCASV